MTNYTAITKCSRTRISRVHHHPVVLVIRSSVVRRLVNAGGAGGVGTTIASLFDDEPLQECRRRVRASLL